MSHTNRFTTVSIGALATFLNLAASSNVAAQDLQSAMLSASIRTAVRQLPATATTTVRPQVFQPVTFPQRTSHGPRATIVAVGAVGGFFGGAYLGSRIERAWFPCRCDDPGLTGGIIGAPIGAIGAGIVAFKLTR